MEARETGRGQKIGRVRSLDFILSVTVRSGLGVGWGELCDMTLCFGRITVTVAEQRLDDRCPRVKAETSQDAVTQIQAATTG